MRSSQLLHAFRNADCVIDVAIPEIAVRLIEREPFDDTRFSAKDREDRVACLAVFLEVRRHDREMRTTFKRHE
jgi:hypothetical protein